MSKEKHTPPRVFYVCTGDKCKKRGSKDTSKALQEYVKVLRLEDEIGIIRTHCTDNCKHGPVICLQPAGEWHFHMDEDRSLALLKKFAGTEY